MIKEDSMEYRNSTYEEQSLPLELKCCTPGRTAAPNCLSSLTSRLHLRLYSHGSLRGGQVTETLHQQNFLKIFSLGY